MTIQTNEATSEVFESTEVLSNDIIEGTEVESTSNVVEEKKRKRTFVSVLESCDVVGMAEYFLSKGYDELKLNQILLTFNEAKVKFVELAIKAAEDKKKEEAELAAKAEEEKARWGEAFKKMESFLIEQGLSPEEVKLSLSRVSFGDKVKRQAKEKDKVLCIYNEKEYLVSVRGNYSGEVKAVLSSTGLTREEFIEKFRKTN
jgi:hypothetical protein